MNMNGSGVFKLYVSPAGNDGNPGTAEAPFASLEAARDAVRRLKTSAGLPQGGVIVWVAGGTYPRTTTFELSEEDSGTAQSPIAYRALGKTPARMLGGRSIGEFHPVSDPEVLARLCPDAQCKVLEADLKAQGISDFGQLKSRGFSRPVVPAGLELFFKGIPMPLARWPNVDFTTISAIPLAASTDDGWGSAVGKIEGGFYYGGERPRHWQWQPEADIWIHGYWCRDWANTCERIDSLDRATGLIRTAAPHAIYGFRAGQRFFFLNVLEELDQPGEWYLDRKKGMLYFWPPASLRGADILVALMETPLVRMRDVSHVALIGLEFEAGREHGVQIEGGRSVLLAGCMLRNLGNYAVVIEGGENHTVRSCEISGTGDGGVKITGGDRPSLTPCSHAVLNCHIHHFSRWSKCYCPAILASGVGMRLAHNRIHDAPHTAILFGGNDFLIEHNEIYNVCMETGDAGAIYTGRDYTFRGNVVQYNFIHHMSGVGIGTMGIYNDDCVSGTRMHGNVFYRASRAALLGGGRDHRVTNNLFVDCKPAIEFDARGLDPHPIWQKMVNVTMKESLEKVNYLKPPFVTRYPELRDLEKYIQEQKGVPPENCRVELFGAMSGSERIGQVFLVPDTPDAPGKALIQKDGRQVLEPAIRFKTISTAEGYELLGLVPQTKLGITGKAQRFLFEAQITTFLAAQGPPQRGTLFGSRAASNNTSRYGWIQIGR